MRSLWEMTCIPCRGDEPILSSVEIGELHPLVSQWKVIDRDGILQLERVFKFESFSRAMEFANRVAQLAEANQHHPSLLVEWGRVTVTWWTHVLRGLHRNDFIMAAKTDQLLA